ncbi:C39 family peptidase [Alicyclobacillus sp. ALC3]|uniref:C39 family peptidase n=1 Tax=Alicyclobacillus sp. ALC3 TaxID=2796143 RepID=UPI0023782FB5|nr:C39 family peptidase [Alicyclobacillus sp. ALC3]WDL98820.1 C39 family peptidase [Alicyclobacillus sp. ALC3]
MDDFEQLRALNATRKSLRQRAARRRRRLVAVGAVVVLGIVGWASSRWWLIPVRAHGGLTAAAKSKQSLKGESDPKVGTVPKAQPNQQNGSVPNNNTTLSQGTTLPASVMLNVPPQNQNPQLPNGCEVTSLSMLFTAIGHPVSKMTLAKEQPYDPTPRVKAASGRIISWGNPNVGFVGSPYVWVDGFGIYHGPIVKLMNKILPGEGLDLTEHPFGELLSYVARGVPVEAWVTANLKPTDRFWETWQTPEGPIRVTQEEHAVLIVGYDQNYIYINNPLTGQKDEPVKRANFLGAWHQLGNQAVTIAAHGSMSSAYPTF